MVKIIFDEVIPPDAVARAVIYLYSIVAIIFYLIATYLVVVPEQYVYSVSAVVLDVIIWYDGMVRTIEVYPRFLVTSCTFNREPAYGYVVCRYLEDMVVRIRSLNNRIIGISRGWFYC